MTSRVGFVAIGRNEGDRLVACLASLAGEAAGTVVYVDSGSTDRSVDNAARRGAEIVNLDMTKPFTAARARNAGARRLLETSRPDYVQFIDGDCALSNGWIAAARAFLDSHSDVAAVCGRRREIRPEASLYNRLCDIEWAAPVGETTFFGGDVLMRMDALVEAGFYDERLVAGEEPELGVRLRERGWKIWRLDADMTRHDAAILRFDQWWKRAVRCGHAYAEVADLHRTSPLRIWRREAARALSWAAIAPLSFLLAVSVNPWFLTALAVYPAQVLRLYLSARARMGQDAAGWAVLTVISRFAEALGAAKYAFGRASGRRTRLIEYK